MKVIKGGYKTNVNFEILLKTNLIEAGENLYFKKKNIDKKTLKIPLKLHSNGIIEFEKLFFSDNKDSFKLNINEDKIKLPDYLKIDDNELPLIIKTKRLFEELKKKKNIVYRESDRKSAHVFIFEKKTKKKFVYNGKKKY